MSRKMQKFVDLLDGKTVGVVVLLVPSGTHDG